MNQELSLCTQMVLKEQYCIMSKTAMANMYQDKEIK